MGGRIGHESLGIFLRFAQNLPSVRDPGSATRLAGARLRPSILPSCSEILKNQSDALAFSILCREGESNSHGLLRTILSRVRLPIPPSRHFLTIVPEVG